MQDMTAIPPNLIALHDYEEQVRAQSLAAVEADAYLATQLQAVHDALDHLVVLVGLDSTPGSDRHTLQLLGIRELNFVSSALKVGMSGYYQVAFALLRDLLETTNLVDLFLSDPKLVSVWKDGDKKTQDRLFKPVAVRMALEKLPKNAGQDRQPKYRNFSTYASHPNYVGFHLLSGDNAPKMGGFFDVKMLKGLLEDMGRLSGHMALNLSLAIKPATSDPIEVYEAKAAFLDRLEAYRRTW